MARPSHLQYTVKNPPQGGTYLEDDDIHGTGFCNHLAVSTNFISKLSVLHIYAGTQPGPACIFTQLNRNNRLPTNERVNGIKCMRLDLAHLGGFPFLGCWPSEDWHTCEVNVIFLFDFILNEF